jgi:deazaflavin-dependent oxidoreductase (nitroreductase family)
MNEKVIEEFRANGGKLGGNFQNMNLLLLGTTGAKTGAKRTNPLAYLKDGARYVVIASFAGGPKDPPWFLNLKATPRVTVEVGSERFEARAEVVAEPERSQLYAKMAAIAPVFTEYQRKTTRTIPVVALYRV